MEREERESFPVSLTYVLFMTIFWVQLLYQLNKLCHPKCQWHLQGQPYSVSHLDPHFLFKSNYQPYQWYTNLSLAPYPQMTQFTSSDANYGGSCYASISALWGDLLHLFLHFLVKSKPNQFPFTGGPLCQSRDNPINVSALCPPPAQVWFHSHSWFGISCAKYAVILDRLFQKTWLFHTDNSPVLPAF